MVFHVKKEFRIGGDCKHGRRPQLCPDCNKKDSKIVKIVKAIKKIIE